MAPRRGKAQARGRLVGSAVGSRGGLESPLPLTTLREMRPTWG